MASNTFATGTRLRLFRVPGRGVASAAPVAGSPIETAHIE